jgi:hypothetical protein
VRSQRYQARRLLLCRRQRGTNSAGDLINGSENPDSPRGARPMSTGACPSPALSTSSTEQSGPPWIAGVVNAMSCSLVGVGPVLSAGSLSSGLVHPTGLGRAEMSACSVWRRRVWSRHANAGPDAQVGVGLGFGRMATTRCATRRPRCLTHRGSGDCEDVCPRRRPHRPPPATVPNRVGRCRRQSSVLAGLRCPPTDRPD